MKTRQELDIEQIKLKTDIKEILKSLDNYRWGGQVIERTKHYIALIRGELGI